MGRRPGRSGLPGLGAAVLALVLVLGGCSDDPEPDGSGTPSGDGAGTGEASPSDASPSDATPSDPGPSDPGSGAGEGSGGTSPQAVQALLPWEPTGGSAEDRRTVGPEWTALVDPRGTAATLSRTGGAGEGGGSRDEVTVRAGDGRVVSEVMMDDRWAVVVGQDEQEVRPSVATVVDLTDGSTHRVEEPEPASGGSWAMHGGTVRFGTVGPGRSYCLAEVDVATGSGETGWCAAKRQGFTRLSAGAHGVGLVTFDDARPVACRTPQLLVDGEPQPVEEAEECSAWDVAATAGGAAWSTVEDERRAEVGTFHAVADGTTYDLGPGTTGTLTPCGDSVYFVRDPQDRRDPARLLRWTPQQQLEVVFESKSVGNAFLAAPECAGGVLTVSAYGAQGDEQVSVTAP